MRIRLCVVAAGMLLAACGLPQPRAGDAGPSLDARAALDGTVYPDATPVDLFRLQFIDPDRGPFSGGTEVMVRGNGFTDSMVITFGGRSVDPLDMEFIDTRRVNVKTPPGLPGLADVQVSRGGQTVTLPDAFTYEAIAVSPSSGSVAGGTYVTIDGLGTSFDSTTAVTFDGALLLNATVINDQQLTGFTPPGVSGTADVRVVTGTEVQDARRGFTYLATADPFAGGMGGGPLAGSLNVVVLNQSSRDGVPDAFVSIGDPTTSAFTGRTDMLGQITFSDPGLMGPVTVHVTAEGYDSSSFVLFDSQNITIYLRRPPEPFTGPFPPGRQIGRIQGHVLFGDATSLGSPTWDLVPEPRTPTEVKRVYVTTTAPRMLSTSYAPDGPIDYEGFDSNKTAWAFSVSARPSALAVVAVAGLYDSARDPSGLGTSGFEPFAMGVKRGILVGPGEQVMNVDVVVNIPLDTTVQVDFDRPPLLNSPGWTGPDHYTVRAYIDFGGEGVVHMNKNGLPTAPAPEEPPNIYRVPDGQESILLSKMAPLTGNLGDASYSFMVGAYSPGGSNPYSVRIARGYRDVSSPVVVDDFLAMPRPVDPAPDGISTGRHYTFSLEGDTTGTSTFNLHMFRSLDGTDLARVFTRGDILTVDLPDFSAEGLPSMPANEDISWTFYRITVPGGSFDNFTYRWLSSISWSAYAADASLVRFPE